MQDLRNWFGEEPVAAAAEEGLIPKDSGEKEHEVLSRIALHSSHVRMTHPSTGEPLEAHAPLAKDMDNFVQLCRKLLLGSGRP